MSENQELEQLDNGPDPSESEPRTVRLVAPVTGQSQSNREWAVAPPPAGSLKAQYTVVERIGDGGMGVVYLARDHKLGRHVALKRLHKTSLANQSLKSRFFREARAVAALNHPNIVHIYSLGEDEDGPYIVMEYVAGPVEASPNKMPPMPFSLADRVHRGGPLSLSEAVNLMLKVCDGVAYAHGCRVIHRDLKPSNVLLNGNYEPKIVDFGLARKLNPDTLRLTLPGEKMLSLGYGAPEQEYDATLSDERADVYGLGGLLYFSLTGQNPRYFRESDVAEALRMPIVKALETDRNKRWPSVRDFESALELVKAPSTIEVPTVKTTWRCKWCDTVNPVLIRYCGKCGWDGGELCAECGSEIRVGIQFCGVCGANAREYEMAKTLESRLQAYQDGKSFELTVQQAGQVSGFKPCGENGRRLVERVHLMADEAGRALARKSRLRELIAQDMANRNYDLAERRITEYETLSKDRPFAEEKARIPQLRTDRHVERAMSSVSHGDWEYAATIARDLQSSAPADPRVQRLSRMLILRRRRIVTRNAAAWAVLAFLLYVLAAPPLHVAFGKSSPRVFKAVFGLALQVRHETVLRRALDWYAAAWGASDVYGQPEPEPPPVVPPPRPPPVDIAPKLAEMRNAFRTDVDATDAEFRTGEASWPESYLKDLSQMQAAMQASGDFEGWSAVTEETERFRIERKLENPRPPPGGTPPADPPPNPTIPALASLRDRYLARIDSLRSTRHQKVVQQTRAYISQLEKVQKELTKEGNMDAAVAVNQEIKRVKSLPDFAAAEEEAARKKAAEPGGGAAK